jgi:hypothetical protein
MLVAVATRHSANAESAQPQQRSRRQPQLTRVAFPVRSGKEGQTATGRAQFRAAQHAAALAMRRDGAVVLCAAADSGQASAQGPDGTSAQHGLLCSPLLHTRARAKATLDALLVRVADTGRDTTQGFEFVEICHRSPLRYDVRAPRFDAVGLAAAGTADSAEPVMPEPFSDLLDALVVPIVAEAYSGDVPVSSGTGCRDRTKTSVVTPHDVKHLADGIVTSLPGAPAQNWHSDGPRGMVTAFVPLVDCVETGTQLWLSSHAMKSAELLAASGLLPWAQRLGLVAEHAAPRLQRGDVLLFDYQIIHRGPAHPIKHPVKVHHSRESAPPPPAHPSTGCAQRTRGSTGDAATSDVPSDGAGAGAEAEAEAEAKAGGSAAAAPAAPMAMGSNQDTCQERPMMYRTFCWHGAGSVAAEQKVHEGAGGVNWPTNRLA